MKIFFIFNAEAFTLENIHPFFTIAMVKNQIHDFHEIHPADQIIYLAHDNNPLDDDQTLHSLNITEGSTLHLVKKGEKSEEN